MCYHAKGVDPNGILMAVSSSQFIEMVLEPVPPTNSDTSGDKCEGLSMTGGGDAEVLRTLASAYVLRPCDTCVLLFRRT